jgi:hypothetical protein
MKCNTVSGEIWEGIALLFKGLYWNDILVTMPLQAGIILPNRQT